MHGARRTAQECRESAHSWFNASDLDAREEIFNASGVRWSELLRLPYFDIIRCVVVDVMHNLFLGTHKDSFLWDYGDITFEGAC